MHTVTGRIKRSKCFPARFIERGESIIDCGLQDLILPKFRKLGQDYEDQENDAGEYYQKFNDAYAFLMKIIHPGTKILITR